MGTIRVARAAALVEVGAKLVAVLGRAGEAIFDSLRDKRATPNEAAHHAHQALRSEDLSLYVKGKDVITPEAQEHLVKGLAIVISNIFAAIHEEPLRKKKKVRVEAE